MIFPFQAYLKYWKLFWLVKMNCIIIRVLEVGKNEIKNLNVNLSQLVLITLNDINGIYIYLIFIFCSTFNLDLKFDLKIDLVITQVFENSLFPFSSSKFNSRAYSLLSAFPNITRTYHFQNCQN